MEQWFYRKSNTRYGPVSLDELKALIVEGDINAETFVWSKSMQGWQQLSTVSVLSKFLLAAASKAPLNGSARSPESGSPDGEGTPTPGENSPQSEKLRALNNLHAEGLLSDAEFNAQKRKLLSGGASTNSNASQRPNDSNEQRPCPPSNLGGAIFATLCCCLPFGVVAIIKATKVASVYQREGYDAAFAASEDAKKWIMLAIGFGIFGIIGQLITEGIRGM